MKIFLDDGMGRSVYEALRRVRFYDVVYVRDEFRANGKNGREVDDVEWLRLVGREHWLAITRDKRILTQPSERDALIEHRAGVHRAR